MIPFFQTLPPSRILTYRHVFAACVELQGPRASYDAENNLNSLDGMLAALDNEVTQDGALDETDYDSLSLACQ